MNVNVKTVLPYIITLVVGFLIFWIIAQQRGGLCSCDKQEMLKQRVQDLERKLLEAEARSTKTQSEMVELLAEIQERVTTLQTLELKRHGTNRQH
jgi:hypothetical protein